MENDFIEMVKEVRKKNKWTQAQLAERIGVHVMTVSRWERGEARASHLALRQLKRLASKNNERME